MQENTRDKIYKLLPPTLKNKLEEGVISNKLIQDLCIFLKTYHIENNIGLIKPKGVLRVEIETSLNNLLGFNDKDYSKIIDFVLENNIEDKEVKDEKIRISDPIKYESFIDTYYSININEKEIKFYNITELFNYEKLINLYFKHYNEILELNNLDRKEFVNNINLLFKKPKIIKINEKIDKTISVFLEWMNKIYRMGFYTNNILDEGGLYDSKKGVIYFTQLKFKNLFLFLNEMDKDTIIHQLISYFNIKYHNQKKFNIRKNERDRKLNISYTTHIDCYSVKENILNKGL